MTAPEHNDSSNWLLRALVVISLGMHVFVFFQIAALYHSEPGRTIEVDLREEKPAHRSIPQPPVRHEPPETKEINKIQAEKPQVPDIKTDLVEADSPEAISEAFTQPDISGLSADTVDWQPPAAEADKYLTRRDYLDMLRLKIESRKKYPPAAQQRQIEGRVVVGFTLDSEGRVTSAEILQSSRHSALDQAALDAVRSAAPFSRPPANLFDGPLEMKITIMFELT